MQKNFFHNFIVMFRPLKHRSSGDKEHGKDKAPLSVAEASQIMLRIKVVSLYTFFSMLRKYWHRYLALAITMAVVLCYYNYTNAKWHSTNILSLNYESGASGRNPNGTRFSISDLRSITNLEAAIESAGLTGLIDPYELTNQISITPTVQRITSSAETYYMSTSYQIYISMSEEYGRLIAPSDMLELICSTYRDVFYTQHIVTSRALTGALGSYDDFLDMEYSEMAGFIDLISSQALNYLNMRVNGAGSFAASDGTTFKSLQQSLTNLVTYDLAKFDAYIWVNGIAKNQDDEISLLTSLNHDQNQKYTQYTQESEMYKRVVDEYDNRMTSSVLIPTYTKDGDYYMSRTKTGVDDLTYTAFDKLKLASECQNIISLNEDRMFNLRLSVTDEEYAQADDLSKNLFMDLSSIINRIELLDNDYIYSSTRNYISYTDTWQSLTSDLDLKSVLIFTAAFCCMLYVFFVEMEKRSLRKIIGKRNTGFASRNGG